MVGTSVLGNDEIGSCGMAVCWLATKSADPVVRVQEAGSTVNRICRLSAAQQQRFGCWFRIPYERILMMGILHVVPRVKTAHTFPIEQISGPVGEQSGVLGRRI